MSRRVRTLVALLRRLVAFLERVYARGRDIQLEIDERERARKAERRAAWDRRRGAVRAKVAPIASVRAWGRALCFVGRWLWRAACFALWLSFTHMLHRHHSTGFALLGWGMFTVLIYGLGAGVGILARAIMSELVVPIVGTLLEYRRWRKANGGAA